MQKKSPQATNVPVSTFQGPPERKEKFLWETDCSHFPLNLWLIICEDGFHLAAKELSLATDGLAFGKEFVIKAQQNVWGEEQ